jgi:hypothetical protein
MAIREGDALPYLRLKQKMEASRSDCFAVLRDGSKAEVYIFQDKPAIEVGEQFYFADTHPDRLVRVHMLEIQMHRIPGQGSFRPIRTVLEAFDATVGLLSQRRFAWHHSILEELHSLLHSVVSGLGFQS